MNKLMLCAGVVCAGLVFTGCNDPGDVVKKYGAAEVENDYKAMNKYTESKRHRDNFDGCIKAKSNDTIKIVGKPEIKGDKATVKYTVEEPIVVEVKEVNGEWKVVGVGR